MSWPKEIYWESMAGSRSSWIFAAQSNLVLVQISFDRGRVTSRVGQADIAVGPDDIHSVPLQTGLLYLGLPGKGVQRQPSARACGLNG